MTGRCEDKNERKKKMYKRREMNLNREWRAREFVLKLKCLIICRKGKFKLDILDFIAITHTKNVHTHTHTQCIHLALYHYSFSTKKKQLKEAETLSSQFCRDRDFRHLTHLVEAPSAGVPKVLQPSWMWLWAWRQKLSHSCVADTQACNGCQTELKTRNRRSFSISHVGAMWNEYQYSNKKHL